ncbi:hypothetical protein D3C78_1748020 [compost metagenome]
MLEGHIFQLLVQTLLTFLLARFSLLAMAACLLIECCQQLADRFLKISLLSRRRLGNRRNLLPSSLPQAVEQLLLLG